MLEVRDMHAGYGSVEVVHGISLDVGEGEFVCVLEANGCGKSTTLKALLGLVEPTAGQVLMDDSSTLSMTDAQRARLMAYVPQSHALPFAYTVHDVVQLGRTPYLGTLSVVTSHDEDVVQDAMVRMGVAELGRRPYPELSGGQQQLVLIARALAQQPRLLLMDEPTSALDFGNQQLVLRQVRRLTREGMGVLMVTHDPDQALLYADRVVVMEEGRILADGVPDQVLDRACLRRVYHVDLEVVEVRVAGRTRRMCVPLEE